MHSIRLDIEDSAFDKIIYFLKNLPKNDVRIIEDTKEIDDVSESDIKAYAGHSANLIQEWKDIDEDDIWK